MGDVATLASSEVSHSQIGYMLIGFGEDLAINYSDGLFERLGTVMSQYCLKLSGLTSNSIF